VAAAAAEAEAAQLARRSLLGELAASQLARTAAAALVHGEGDEAAALAAQVR
jgi:hypothetical protein